MMASESSDLLSIGQHCSVPHCHRLDFLPFKCEKCKGLFCIDHRTPKEHDCVNQSIGDVVIPKCPLCDQFIQRAKHQSANDQVEAHIMSGCKELILRDNSTKHPNRCSYKTCRKYELVPITCPSCSKIYCIKHRLEREHTCSLIKVN